MPNGVLECVRGREWPCRVSFVGYLFDSEGNVFCMGLCSGWKEMTVEIR